MTVRSLVCRELGPLDGLVVEDREGPVARAGELVVAVRAAGVNFVDGLICQGLYQIRPPTPFVPGSEIAGVVTAVGDGVDGVGPGARVAALTGFGGFAEQVRISAAAAYTIPERLTFGQAATFIQSYATALFALTRRTTVSAGEWVLVLGAGGGIGLAAVDVARALGARVIGAASSRAKLDAARSMGAEATVAYEDEDLKARARELSGGGVDVVIDPVGGRHAEPALRATKPFGRLCVVGFAGGSIPSLPLNQVLLNNRTVVGVDWGAWMVRHAEDNRVLLDELFALAAGGRVHPAIPTERPLADAAGALADLLDRKVTGKLVLVP